MRRFKSPDKSEDEPLARRTALQHGSPLQRGQVLQIDASHITISSGTSIGQRNQTHVKILSGRNESALEYSASPVFAPAADSNYTIPKDTYDFMTPLTSTLRRCVLPL